MKRPSSPPKKTPLASVHQFTDGEAETPAMPFKLIGVHEQPDHIPCVYIQHPGGKYVAVPLNLCNPAKQSMLYDLLLRAGLIVATTQLPLKAIAARLLHFAATCTTRVIAMEGFHTVVLAGKAHRVLVHAGVCHWLAGEPEGAAVVLVGDATKTIRPIASHKEFRDGYGLLVCQQPRMLVVLLFALAAVLAPEFDVLLVALLLVGQSSIGKSIIQSAASLLVSGKDKLRQLNATPQGLIEFIQAQGAQAVYLDDTHGAKVCEALCDAIMASGNGAESRLRSGHALLTVPEAPIRGALVLSAEASLADTVRSGRGTLRSGLYARVLEVHPGAHGMFDDLCGHEDSAALASHVKEQAHEFAGVVGTAFFEKVAYNWDTVWTQWPKNRERVNSAILEASGMEKVDGVMHRLTQAMTFVGFVGAIAANYGVLPLKRRDVFNALGLLLREQSRRLHGARTPVQQAVIEAVQLFIQTNPAKFLPIEQAGDAVQVNGLAGFSSRGKSGLLYLFFPAFFKKQFVSKFGEEAYGHLRTAGHLRSTKSRENRYQVRVPMPGDAEEGKRRDFVAISASILVADD